EPAAVQHPGVHLAGVQAERHSRIEAERGVLAKVVVGRGMSAFDRAVLHGIQYLQGRHNLAGRKGADVELAARGRVYILGEVLATAVDGVRTARKTRCQAPVYRWRVVGKHRRGERRGTGGSAQGGLLDE